MQTLSRFFGFRLPRHMAADAASIIETHLACVDKPVTQSLARALQTGLCGGKVQSEDLGKLGLGLTLQVTGAKDGGVIGRQLGKHARETVRQRVDRSHRLGEP